MHFQVLQQLQPLDIGQFRKTSRKSISAEAVEFADAVAVFQECRWRLISLVRIFGKRLHGHVLEFLIYKVVRRHFAGMESIRGKLL